MKSTEERIEQPADNAIILHTFYK